MGWSWQVGKILGIKLRVHATFTLILLWVGMTAWMGGRSLEAALGAVLFVLLVFGCVVLHEFGHAIAARRFGVGTRDIILLPIGGVARLERIPEDPRQELAIAAAGPMVNVVIAATLALGMMMGTGSLAVDPGVHMMALPLPLRLLVVNLFLFAFNLIPAFPMDGGRVLRALLALRLEYTHATEIASTIGQGMAFLFGFAGLLTNPFLVFIALFVWIGAREEANLVKVRSALGGIPVQHVMLTEFHTLAPDDPLARAAELTLSGSQTDFPVLDADEVVGILTQADLVRGLSEYGESSSVSATMHREFHTASPREMIEPVFLRLQASHCGTIPVLDQRRLVGLVNAENVGEFLRFQSVLGERGARRSSVREGGGRGA